jgi:disulfide bond formation protein DsbB
MSAGTWRAHWIALLLPAVLLAGAWGSQLIGGLHPCEMCHWQRWPHYGALVLAGLAFVIRTPGVRRILIAGAAALIAVSGLIGVYHAGVEYHWWQGVTACTASPMPAMSAEDRLRAILAAPVIRCDAAQWTLAGVSLAGWNAIFSLVGAVVIGWQLRRRG